MHKRYYKRYSVHGTPRYGRQAERSDEGGDVSNATDAEARRAEPGIHKILR